MNKRPILDYFKDFSHSFPMSYMEAVILGRRGLINATDMLYHDKRNPSYLPSPFYFQDMQKAISRLLEAKLNEESIFILGDTDIDGITSIYILSQYLDKNKYQFQYEVMADGENYGLTKDHVDRCQKKNIDLIILVDCGTSNYESVNLAQSVGMDVIIIDHHLAHQDLPKAIALLNPRIEGDKYPFPDISSASIVAKFLWALEFVHTPWYGQKVVFFYLDIENKQLHLVFIYHMCLEKEIIWDLDLNTAKQYNEKLADILSDQYIIAYQAQKEKKKFEQCFGYALDLVINDLALPDSFYCRLHRAFSQKSNISWQQDISLAQLWEKEKRYYPAFYQAYPPSSLNQSPCYRHEFSDKACFYHDVYQAYVFFKYPLLEKSYEDSILWVGLSILADCMPLNRENRLNVIRMLEAFQKNTCIPIRLLLDACQIEVKEFNTEILSWQLIPVLNSAGRLNKAQLVLDYFFEKEYSQQKILLNDIIACNQDRKNILIKHFNQVKKDLIRKDNKTSADQCIYLEIRSLPVGLTGLLASRVSQYFNKVTFILAPEKEKIWNGSIRVPSSERADKILDEAKDFFIDYGGHPQAGGFSIFEEKKIFFQKFISQVKISFDETDNHDKDYVDAEIFSHNVDKELFYLHQYFSPFGKGSNPIIFYIKKVKVDQLELFGKSDPMHLKLRLQMGDKLWPAIWWKSSEQYKDQSFQIGDYIDIQFICEKSQFKHNLFYRLNIQKINFPSSDG